MAFVPLAAVPAAGAVGAAALYASRQDSQKWVRLLTIWLYIAQEMDGQVKTAIAGLTTQVQQHLLKTTKVSNQLLLDWTPQKLQAKDADVKRPAREARPLDLARPRRRRAMRPRILTPRRNRRSRSSWRRR